MEEVYVRAGQESIWAERPGWVKTSRKQMSQLTAAFGVRADVIGSYR